MQDRDLTSDTGCFLAFEGEEPSIPLEERFIRALVYLSGKDPLEAKTRDWYQAVAHVVRDALVSAWLESMRDYYLSDVKKVYYLSMEFLMGRTLMNALSNLKANEAFARAIENMGLSLEEMTYQESEAGLGNGGLGRLAACFLDSLATLGLPGFGYGIRYEYGLFSQEIQEGWQIEHPDPWLRFGNPWEFPRPEIQYRVQFGGSVRSCPRADGSLRFDWVDTDDVMAMAYDTPIPGYGGATVNTLRLWSARATADFDLRYFNEGNYIRAVEQRTRSENLSKVLYPDDSTLVGRELRLKQEYFFVSASLQDLLQGFVREGRPPADLPEKLSIQMNDTHPALVVPELMRLLIDLWNVEWAAAWDITRACCNYTNHTLMPEALETWPIALFERLLPRHLSIIYEINSRFLESLSLKDQQDLDLVRRISLIDEEQGRRIRMSHLAIVGSHRVNGVAALHSALMQTTIFKDFATRFPERFINITNGVTPRRWLHQANPGLSALITEAIGDGWIRDFSQIAALEAFADDDAFLARFATVRRQAKQHWQARSPVRIEGGIDLSSLFDVQIKRIHEYKRQFLKVLETIDRYLRITAGEEGPPRTVIIGGKAAPAYAKAKLIIKLINSVAETVNADPRAQDLLKVAFLPDYGVGKAMHLIPAADLSEQISTAGTEASGTGNMKLMMNGALTVGTYDGANIEMIDAMGRENFFLFGLKEPDIRAVREKGYDPADMAAHSPRLMSVLEALRSGLFSPDQPGLFEPLIRSLLIEGDPFMVVADFDDYLRIQQEVDQCFMSPRQWARKAILNIARSGRFSSDRAILQYAKAVWGLKCT